VVERRAAWVARGDGKLFEAWVYRPASREPAGAILLVPGLHPLGPADPRLDRFCAILGDAGFLVLAPFLPDFTRLEVSPALATDTAAALEALVALPDYPRGVAPGLFSISFGSLPALRVASSPAWAERIGGLVVFGGYADFADAVRFALRGAPGRPRDPLNRPAVFVSLLGDLDPAPRDPEALRDAWLAFVRQTWGRPEMKAEARWTAVARALASRVHEDDRALYERTMGLAPSGEALADAALVRAAARVAELDPRTGVDRIRRPVRIVHGRDDDVIPFEHAEILRAALPPAADARVMLTGLYAHTGTLGPRDLAALVPAASREVAAMASILRAIVEVGTRRA
jgi:pimeloyl-ACP methyl ester carboxylesterase